MGRDCIEQYLWLMNEGFDGGGGSEHPFIKGLRSARDEDWHWLPPDGRRSIFEMVEHVGECKYVYDNHAFGDGSMRWDRPGSIPSIERTAAPAEVIEWLREGQRRLRASVAALADDAELLRPRRAPWGREYETRWLINTMIQHDTYHAGEINHVRALRQKNDRWAYEQEET
jgi:uncharacterized damage-inducible protein DinB